MTRSLARRTQGETPLPKGRAEAAFSRMLRLAIGGPDHLDVLVLQNEPIIEKIAAALPEMRSEIYRAVPEQSARHALGRGSPDLLLVIRGIALFLELKAHDGVLAPHQIEWHDAARARGVHVAVVRLDADTVEGAERAIEVVKAAIERIRGLLEWTAPVPLLGAGEAVAAVEEVRGGKHG